MDLNGKKICVIGAGKSGIGATELLADTGAHITVYDSNDHLQADEVRKKFPERADIEIVLGEFPKELAQTLDLAVISPGVPTDLDYVELLEDSGVPVWGELELAYRFEKGEVLAVTGTNGKTTTTSLLGHLMQHWKEKVFVVGNIGIPYTEMAAQTSEDSVTVAEVSSFQLEKAPTFHPGVSAILNITPDHLNRHHTMENYTKIKESITANQDSSDFCILNYEDAALREFGEMLQKKNKVQVLFFSSLRALNKGMYLDGENIIYSDGSTKQVLCHVHDLQLIGTHNYENVMAAAGMALCAGVPMQVITEALPSFEAVPHRIEYAGEVGGVRYYNDSKGTNPDAAIKGIQAMRWPTYLIAGGYDKGADYSEWIRAFDGKVRKLVLIGATKENIAEAAKKEGFTDIVFCETFEEAFSFCSYHAEKGEAVLLSPACASWGMFDNYEQRGDRFKELVKKLGENG